MKIHELFNLVKNTGGSNDKLNIIRENLSDTLVQIYQDTFDTSRNYYVKKYNKNLCTGTCTIEKSYVAFHDILNALNKRTVTGNAAVELLEYIISQFIKEDQEVLHSIVDRNLKIGVSEESFNKIHDLGINKFEVALAYNLDKVKGVNPIDGTYYASRKLDGVRCIAIVDTINQEVTFKSRQGKEFTTLDKLKQVMLDMCKNAAIEKSHHTWVFDGELCAIDENGNEDFSKAIQQVTKKNVTAENIKYCIFDIIQYEDFVKGESNVPFSLRYKLYNEIYDCSYSNETIKKYIGVLHQELITSQEQFDKWTKLVSENNWEGFMLRKNTGYKSGRNKDLIKVKKFQDAEYVVTGYELGDIKYGTETFKDIVKCLHIIHKGNRVNVGSGISKEQRILWKNEPWRIIGKTITVQYFEETTNKNDDTLSLRFPVLKYVYKDGRSI